MTTELDADALRELTAFKVDVHDPRYAFERVVGGGEFLYDPQVFWDWNSYDSPWNGPEGSILISDIAGQQSDDLDTTLGHGAIYRLHADNSFETIMAPGVGRQCGVFRPMIAPAGFGDYGGHIFFGSQVAPHRKGARMDHLVYRLGPGERTPDAFCIPPRVDGLVAGGLMPGVFGRPGTPEEGLFLVFALLNRTVYAIRPDGSVEPWLTVDGKDGRAGPIMPFRLFYADEEIVGEKDVLVMEGQWNGSWVDDEDHGFVVKYNRIAGRSLDPTPIEALVGGAGHRAPPGFGPFAGDMFRIDNAGYISSIHWAAKGDGSRPLPYTVRIMRRDRSGQEHVFASNIQAGQNLLGFSGDRMIVSNLGHSFSSGDFKYPDGSVFAIRFQG